MLDNWNSYKLKYGKSYSDHKDSEHRSIFYQRVSEIDAHNKDFENGKSTFKLGINHLTDYTEEEFNHFCGYRADTRLEQQVYASRLPELLDLRDKGCVTPVNDQLIDGTFWASRQSSSASRLPELLDLRDKGCVTPVKDQLIDGTCWAFAATGSLEGQLFFKTKKLVSLSEQQLIDCILSFRQNGCTDGSVTEAFDYIKNAPGITSAEQYPNEDKINDTCRYSPNMQVGTVTGYTNVPPNDEYKLMSALAGNGPIAISINVNKKFKDYKSGIYNEVHQSRNLNHAVLLVGYGSKNSIDYWIIKNSWGTDWGENGYMYIQREKHNLWGVTSEPKYPNV